MDDRVRLLAAIIRFSVTGGDWDSVGAVLGITPRAAEERWKAIRGNELLLAGITASGTDMKLSRNPGGKGKGKKLVKDEGSDEESEPDLGKLSISNDKAKKTTKRKGTAGKKNVKFEVKAESSAEEEEEEAAEEGDEKALSGSDVDLEA